MCVCVCVCESRVCGSIAQCLRDGNRIIKSHHSNTNVDSAADMWEYAGSSTIPSPRRKLGEFVVADVEFLECPQSSQWLWERD